MPFGLINFIAQVIIIFFLFSKTSTLKIIINFVAFIILIEEKKNNLLEWKWFSFFFFFLNFSYKQKIFIYKTTICYISYKQNPNFDNEKSKNKTIHGNMSFNLKHKNRVSLRVFLIEIFLIKVVLGSVFRRIMYNIFSINNYKQFFNITNYFSKF